MDIKVILKKLAQIDKKADKSYVTELINEIQALKERVNQLEMSNSIYFEEIEKQSKQK